MTFARKWLTGCALSLLAAGATHAQQLAFVTPDGQSLTGLPGDILIADANDDGLPDVLISIVTQARVAVLLNTGPAGLAPANYVQAPFSPTKLAAGDFDSNGIMDLMVTETESDFVYLLIGQGDGNFDFPVWIPADHDPAAIEAIDMNGDGILDLVTATASEVGGQANILLGTGDGTFEYDPLKARRLSSQAVDVATGDFNGDGIPDVVVPGLDGNIGVLLGDGTGSLDRVELTRVGQQLLAVKVADLDGDGILDVVAADSGGFRIWVLLGDGRGGFAVDSFVPVAGSPWSLRLRDVDLDGHVDAIVTKPASAEVSIVRGRGDGSFHPPRHYVAHFRPFAADAVDLDGDGFVDIIAASQGGAGGVLNLIRGSADGFHAAEGILHAAQPTAITARDMNRDCRPDLVYGSVADLSISVVERLAGGEFTPPQAIVEGTAVLAFQIGDVDGDGLPDVVAAANNRESLVFARGRVDGTFADREEVPLPWQIDAVAIGDLDGDGIQDVAVRSLRGSHAVVAVLYGPISGDEPQWVDLDVDGKPRGLDVLDADGDGHLDVLIGNENFPAISLYYGNGTREWDAPTQITTSAPTSVLAWNDVDGDGAVDLAYGQNNGVRLLYGDTERQFAPGPLLSVPGAVTAIAIRDLTGDLRPDVAALSQTVSGMLTYANSGSRFDFGEPVTVPLGPNLARLLTADLDGDGRYDTIAIGAAVWPVLNSGAAAALRGDANGDGRIGAADLTAFVQWHRAGRRFPVEVVRGSGGPGFDGNGDGWIDDQDWPILLMRLFGNC